MPGLSSWKTPVVLTGTEEPICLGSSKVISWREISIASCLKIPKRLLDNSEGFETKEINLRRPMASTETHIELGRDGTRRWDFIERRIFGERFREILLPLRHGLRRVCRVLPVSLRYQVSLLP